MASPGSGWPCSTHRPLTPDELRSRCHTGDHYPCITAILHAVSRALLPAAGGAQVAWRRRAGVTEFVWKQKPRGLPGPSRTAAGAWQQSDSGRWPLTGVTGPGSGAPREGVAGSTRSPRPRGTKTLRRVCLYRRTTERRTLGRVQPPRELSLRLSREATLSSATQLSRDSSLTARDRGGGWRSRRCRMLRTQPLRPGLFFGRGWRCCPHCVAAVPPQGTRAGFSLQIASAYADGGGWGNG
jgi:hypothetical protein